MVLFGEDVEKVKEGAKEGRDEGGDGGGGGGVLPTIVLLVGSRILHEKTPHIPLGQGGRLC